MSYLEHPQTASTTEFRFPFVPRRQSADQFSDLARLAMLTSSSNSTTSTKTNNSASQSPPPEIVVADGSNEKDLSNGLNSPRKSSKVTFAPEQDKEFATRPLPNAHTSSLGRALTDTPLPSVPGSPRIPGKIGDSGISTPRIRATTLDIPGLTRSRVSPDGRIADRDVGAKLVILMVGLPARGKSYIVKKIARYLNWAQHPTRIFNVGERRRVVAGKGSTIPAPASEQEKALRESIQRMSIHSSPSNGLNDHENLLGPPATSSHPHSIAKLVHNERQYSNGSPISPLVTTHTREEKKEAIPMPPPEKMEQDAAFFDPDNAEAKRIRDQVAHETLDELLAYVFDGGGSIGILDATNHTQERRMALIKHIRERDPTINVLFLESRCQNRKLLEANMRLKLSGPDYKGKDPVKSLHDFEQRVEQYEKKYEPLGDFEEEHEIPYCSMIDVGRKMVTFKTDGFLSIQTITYLMNFNLAPRQIWLTRHGESVDNVQGKLGGDSHLSSKGIKYARALEKFVGKQRALWEQAQIDKRKTTHFPPLPGDTTPPNPEVEHAEPEGKNFCVWTSMLNRSVETSQFFCEDEYDIKQMRMLDELNAGVMEGMTYQDIKSKYQDQYELRKRDKLMYRYPGPGGEGYLDIINRLRKVILEIERTQDHILVIGHRSITRVLLAYFQGLKQEDISDLDVPLGVVYMLEPRPYGTDFKAYRWNPDTDEFTWEENYKLRRATEPQ